MNELKKNEEYQGVITGYTSDGDGVCRIGDKVVFIPNTVVHDKCTFKVLKVTKNVSFGRLVNIITPSPDRIEPICDISEKCGGCSYFHMSYEEELRAKQEKVVSAFRKIARINLEEVEVIGSEKVLEYRNKAQYPVGQDGLDMIFGFYRKNSNDIVPCTRCHILPEISDKITKATCEILERLGIRPYDKVQKTGVIRHIYVRISDVTGQILLTIIATRNLMKYASEITEELVEKFPMLCGIVVNVNRDTTNKVLGDKYFTLYGNDYMEDELCGNKFKISPAAFYQVNRSQAEKLYQCAIDFTDLKGSETVVELFCGAGTISLALAKHASEVYGIEIVNRAVQNAKDNAKLNNIENVSFICADATQGAQMIIEEDIVPDVVVVDPPRKGLDVTAIDAICEMSPKKIVYVSCDPATLARDVAILTEKGYTLEKYKAFDLFPRTHHVETVVSLVCTAE